MQMEKVAQGLRQAKDSPGLYFEKVGISWKALKTPAAILGGAVAYQQGDKALKDLKTGRAMRRQYEGRR